MSTCIWFCFLDQYKTQEMCDDTDFSNDAGLNTNLDDNFDEDNSEIIIHIRLMVWCNAHKQHKACKKEIS